jgi:hypothetical protein
MCLCDPRDSVFRLLAHHYETYLWVENPMFYRTAILAKIPFSILCAVLIAGLRICSLYMKSKRGSKAGYSLEYLLHFPYVSIVGRLTCICIFVANRRFLAKFIRTVVIKVIRYHNP